MGVGNSRRPRDALFIASGVSSAPVLPVSARRARRLGTTRRMAGDDTAPCSRRGQTAPPVSRPVSKVCKVCSATQLGCTQIVSLSGLVSLERPRPVLSVCSNGNGPPGGARVAGEITADVNAHSKSSDA